mmetsp:Transcript_30668/g.61423  ORF Transcript_30668/g.61423 Transcript_30668/m.61423 type:complete len:320 (-) Transcript_30668:194-1153(-)
MKRPSTPLSWACWFCLHFAAVNSFGPPRSQFLLGANKNDNILHPPPPNEPSLAPSIHRTDSRRSLLPNDANESQSDEGGSSYESSGSFTKGIVSSLTSVSNFLFPSPLTYQNNIQAEFSPTAEETTTTTTTTTTLNSTTSPQNNPPTTPQELLQRITKEYTQNNYLWTGNIDTSSFRPDCRFTDPTLSFVGVDKFVSNVGSLVPIVEFLLGSKQSCQSKLLSIGNDAEGGYIETRWNMVGELDRLPWKPRIDVIGRTKFWYSGEENQVEEVCDGDSRPVQVYFYDEMWEIPAGLALLQLVTPAGTIANSNCASGDDVIA